MEPMKLRHMEVFHAIMRTGSVTGAARVLNVTQPAVSTMLKNCERQLQLKLFERRGGRFLPTPEAQAILPDVSSIFARLDHISDVINELAEGRAGSLNIAASMAVANSYVAKAVATFVSGRPCVTVELMPFTSPQTLEAVLNGDAELGIAFAPIDNPAIETEVLLRAPLTCVMRDDHPLAALDEIDIVDLAAYPLVSYLPQAMLRPVVEEILAAAKVTPDLSVQVNLSLLGMMIARRSRSVALVEPFLLNVIRLPNLVARKLRPVTPLTMVLVTQKATPPSRVMFHFIAHLKAIVAEEGLTT